MERRLSAASLPTDLACMTWQAMFGSGARIGMAVLTTPRAHLPTPQDPRLVRTVCGAAATGTSTPTTAARRGATATRPSASAPTSASVSRGLRNSIYPCRLRQAEPAFIFHFLFFLFTSPNLGVRHGLVATKAVGCRAVPPTGCGNFLKSKNDLWTFPRPSPRSGIVRGLRQSQSCHTPVYGQKSLIFGSFLPVNRGYAFRTALSARKQVLHNYERYKVLRRESNSPFLRLLVDLLCVCVITDAWHTRQSA